MVDDHESDSNITEPIEDDGSNESNHSQNDGQIDRDRRRNSFSSERLSNQIIDAKKQLDQLAKQFAGNQRFMKQVLKTKKIAERFADSHRVANQIAKNKKIAEKMSNNQRLMRELSKNQEIAERLAGNQELAEQLVETQKIAEQLTANKEAAVWTSPHPNAFHQFQISQETVDRISEFSNNIDKINQPAVNSDLVETLNSLSQTLISDSYKIAVALDQIEQGATGSNKDRFSDSEEPRQEGIVSDFFDFTSLYILNNKEGLSEESKNALESIILSDTIREKTRFFNTYIKSLSESGLLLVAMAARFSCILTCALYFPPEEGEEGAAEEER